MQIFGTRDTHFPLKDQKKFLDEMPFGWTLNSVLGRTWSCREPVCERLHLEILDSFLAIIISIGGISSLC